MRMRFYLVTAAAILFFMCPLRSWGQDEQQKPPAGEAGEPQLPSKLLIGNFVSEGSVNFGYRFVTQKGDRAQYDNIYNLNDGFRLLDMHLAGRASEGSHLFADFYSLTVNGLGGDPYQGGQFVLRKEKLYDLRINYRQSRYYWSQNNNDMEVMRGLGVPLAEGGAPSAFTSGLTANHSWATVRRLGSMNLSIRATNRLQLNFEFERNSRNGTSQTTRSLYYEGTPTASTGRPSDGWASLGTANPYVVAAPIDELQTRITGGVDYTLSKWIFHYRVGYQSFSQNTDWSNLTSPERSINTSTAATASELLTNASWSEFRHVTTPVSEFSYNGKVNSRLELRGGYNYYRYSGPFTADASFIGMVRTTSAATAFTPYAVALNTRAHVDEPMHDISQGFTVKINEWWNFNADYRYTRLTSDAYNEFNSFYNGAAALPGLDDEQWKIGSHLADINMEFNVHPSLMIRTGVRYLKRDAAQLTNGVINEERPGTSLHNSTLRTKSVYPTISVFYKPSKMFSVRGDFQSNTTTKPYTRVSAHTDIGSRFVFRFKPTDKLSIEDNLVVRNGQRPESSYRNRYRSNAINVSYSFSDTFAINAGSSYENIFMTAAHVRANATTPFDGFWQEAFINRGWRGGLTIKPLDRFGIDLSGNYLRTTGASRLYSTVPASALGGLPIVWPVNVGPLTFPQITGTVYYDFPKAGRLSIDLQRSYYAEELVRGNNFSVNMLTIRWTKSIGGEGD